MTKPPLPNRPRDSDAPAANIPPDHNPNDGCEAAGLSLYEELSQAR